MADYKTIRVENKEGVVWLTLNRPEFRNAQTNEMGDEFRTVIEGLNKDSSARVLVLTGEGESFCSGGDLKMLESEISLTAENSRSSMLDFYWKFLSLTKLEIPTIAMINGHAIGAGLMMALACDLRVISKKAKFGAGFIKIGFSPGMGATHILPRLLGISKALELMWSSEMFDADKAMEMGLANKIAEPEELFSVTENLAKQLAAGPTIPMKLLKKAVYRQVGADLPRALEIEALCQSIVFRTDDYKEGVKAMREKREAKFKGK